MKPTTGKIGVSLNIGFEKFLQCRSQQARYEEVSSPNHRYVPHCSGPRQVQLGDTELYLILHCPDVKAKEADKAVRHNTSYAEYLQTEAWKPGYRKYM